MEHQDDSHNEEHDDHGHVTSLSGHHPTQDMEAATTTNDIPDQEDLNDAPVIDSTLGPISLLLISQDARNHFWYNVREFYKEGTFCDLRFRCCKDGKQREGDNATVVDCHRFVLSLLSKTIRYSLPATSEESVDAITTITLPDFGYAEVKATVDAIYEALCGQFTESSLGLIFGGDFSQALEVTSGIAEDEACAKVLPIKVEVTEGETMAEIGSRPAPKPKRKRGRPKKKQVLTDEDFSFGQYDLNVPSDSDSTWDLSDNEESRRKKRKFGRRKDEKLPKIDLEVKERQCDTCGEVFQTRDRKEYLLYHRHVRNHKFEKTQCGCQVSFSNPHQKKVHFWLHHSNGRYQKCDKCSYIGPAKTMDRHTEAHAKGAVCEVCGKEIPKSAVSTHWQNIHREYKCPDCGEVIYGNRLYRRHRDRVHHEPFQCDQCTYVCKDKKQLSSHKLIVHRSDAEKPYRCDICGKGFVARNKVDIHMMNVHIKTRPYVCTFGCGAAYNDKSTLRQHEKRKHQGIPPPSHQQNMNQQPPIHIRH